MSEQRNPFLITPPPGGFPRRDDASPSGESTTHKVPAGRPPVVFTPVAAPGAPVVPPAAQAAAAPAPVAPPAPVVEQPAIDPEATVVRPAGSPPPEQQSAPAAPGVRLVAPDGARLPVDRALVLGRKPAAPSQHPGAVPVPVADASRTVSKTHALVEPVAGGLRVIDLGSTNGVRIQSVRGARILRPHEPDVAEPGDVVQLGDLVLRVDA